MHRYILNTINQMTQEIHQIQALVRIVYGDLGAAHVHIEIQKIETNTMKIQT